MIISVTERQLFKRCRRKWDYSSFNRQSLVPVINSPALDLGTLIHQVLATWTQDQLLDPEEVYASLSMNHLKDIMVSYEQRIGCKPSKEELTPQVEAIALGANMIRNYKDHWHTPLPPGFSLVENEQTLIQPIPNTEHMLEAQLDGIMADEHGQLFIIERKTFSRAPSVEELDRKDQFLAYMWILQRSLPDKYIVGVAYDGLRKRDKPPAGKPLADLFIRRITLRNKHELREFEQYLTLEALDMCDPNVRLYKNELVLGGCWDCNFRDLCDAESRNENVNNALLMYHRVNRKEWRDGSQC